jgi:hypothetical protein
MVFMKSYSKLFGIIVLLAMIGLVMVGCGEDPKDGLNAGNTNNTNNNPSTENPVDTSIVYLRASRWGTTANETSWNSKGVFKLSDFYAGTLTQYAHYEITMSGEVDTNLTNLSIMFYDASNTDWVEMGNWPAAHSITSGSFSKEWFLPLLPNANTALDPSDIVVEISTENRLDDSTAVDTLMATISDFSITIKSVDTDSFFSGTWVDTLSDVDQIMTFTGNTWTAQLVETSEFISRGTWTVQGNKLITTTTHGAPPPTATAEELTKLSTEVTAEYAYMFVLKNVIMLTDENNVIRYYNKWEMPEYGNPQSINIASAPGCIVKVTNTPSAINSNDYTSVSSMTSITEAASGSPVYVIVIPESESDRIQLFPLTISGVPANNISYHDRFRNTYGPIQGAIYTFTMPDEDITINAEAAIAPVTVNGTVSLTMTSGSLGSNEQNGLSIDFMVNEIPGSSIAGAHVPNALDTTANWSIQCIPNTTYIIQGRVRLDTDQWVMKNIGTITLDNSGNVTSGSTTLSAVFP